MDSKLLREQPERHEGLRLKPYKDTVGKLTIGIGRNLDDKGISREEAFALLDNDIAEVVRQLEQVDEYQALDDARQTVLANMCFNLGLYGLMGFRKMWLALTRNDYHEAAKQMLDSRWARQVGYRADELAQIMRTGQA